MAFLVEATLVNHLISAVLPHQQEETLEESAEDEKWIDCKSYMMIIQQHTQYPFLGDKLTADDAKPTSDFYDQIQTKSLTIAESKELLKLEEC